MKGRVLLTGGAGFIGSHVADQLLEAGWSVRVLDNLELPTHAAGRPAYLSPDLEFIQGDVRDSGLVTRVLDGVDAVVHLAATGGFTPDWSRYIDSNSVGTARMLEAIRDSGQPIQKIVVASSIAIYGEGAYQCSRHGLQHPPLRTASQLDSSRWELECPTCSQPLVSLPTPESKPACPAKPYSISKYDQERLVLNFGREHGVAATALRYFVTYGPRQSLSNPYTGLLTIFCNRIRAGLAPVVYEDGRQTRDFVFVEDTARATVHALHSSLTDGGVFNVGTGQAVNVMAVARELLRLSGAEGMEPSVPNRYRPGEVRHMLADTRLLEATGFRSRISFSEGVERTYDWIRREASVGSSFQEAERELLRTGVVRQVADRS